jgi:hypothetical protein
VTVLELTEENLARAEELKRHMCVTHEKGGAGSDNETDESAPPDVPER